MCDARDGFPDTIPVTPIEVDSELGLKLGLTSKTFVPTTQCSEDYPIGTQLFRRGNCMYIQAVEVWLKERKKGHFNDLLKILWTLGFIVKVPNPTPCMEKILRKKGFIKTEEQDLNSSKPEIQVVYFKYPPIQ